MLFIFSIFFAFAINVSGNLLAQDASDGFCLPPRVLWRHLFRGADALPGLKSTDWYVPMASKALYRHYAEGLLGRPAESQKELDSMQLIINTYTAGVLWVNNTGFPRAQTPAMFTQICDGIAVPNIADLGLRQGRLNLNFIQAFCVGWYSKLNGRLGLVPSFSFAVTADSLLWMNEEATVALIYRCPTDGIKDFKVLSTKPYLTSDVIAIIKDKVKRLGFKKENIAYMYYKNY